MTDMVYTVYRSKHAGGPSGLKRMQVVPKDANNRNFSSDYWDKLFNIRVKYKRPFLVDLAV